jgi:hypothetical protein
MENGSTPPGRRGASAGRTGAIALFALAALMLACVASGSAAYEFAG